MEEKEIDPDYLKGFNDCYLIAQHEPKLSEQLSKVKGDSPRLRGMQDGRQQFLSEQIKNKLPDWLKNDRTSQTSKQPHKDKGIDMDSKD